MRLYCGNLAYTASDTDLRNFFSPRRLTDVKIVTDRETGQPRGFGFVEMSDADAHSAIGELDGENLLGRPLKISEAKDKKTSGGGGRGRSRDHERGSDGERQQRGGKNRDW